MTTDFDAETVVAQTTGRLVERFPDEDRDAIERMVREEVSGLVGMPVNDYIAVLSERAVKKRLKAGQTKR